MNTPSLNRASIWDSIDGVLVLNLDRSPERMERFMQKNGHLIPADKIVRISAAYGRDLPGYGEAPWFTERTGERAKFWAGTAGCALSHRRAIEYASAHGWKTVLILEDDAVLNATDDGLWLMRCALRALKGRYMLYPGFSRPTPYGRCIRRKGDSSLWQVEGVLSTFAYLVPQSMYDRLLALMPTEDNIWEWMSIHRAIDTFYKDTAANLPGVKIYAIQPDLVMHIDGMSDVAGSSVTYTGRYDNSLKPHSYFTLAGVLHVLAAPLRRLKVRLNAIRTHRRALRGGLPGFRKRRQKRENKSN